MIGMIRRYETANSCLSYLQGVDRQRAK
jgi:hypothetical protein